MGLLLWILLWSRCVEQRGMPGIGVVCSVLALAIEIWFCRACEREDGLE